MKKKTPPILDDDDDEIIDLTEIIESSVKHSENKESIHFEDLISERDENAGLDLDDLLNQLGDPSPDFRMPNAVEDTSEISNGNDDDLDSLFNDAIKEKRAKFEADLTTSAPREEEPKATPAPSLDSIEDLDTLLGFSSAKPAKSTDSLADIDAELEALLGTSSSSKEQKEEISIDSLDELLKVEDETVALPLDSVDELLKAEDDLEELPLDSLDELLKEDLLKDNLEEETRDSHKEHEEILEIIEQKIEKPIDSKVREKKTELETHIPSADPTTSVAPTTPVAPTPPVEPTASVVPAKPAPQKQNPTITIDLKASKPATTPVKPVVEPELKDIDQLIDSLDAPPQPKTSIISPDESDLDSLEDLDSLLDNPASLIDPSIAQLKSEFDIDLPPTNVLTVEESADFSQLKSEMEEITHQVQDLEELLEGFKSEISDLKNTPSSPLQEDTSLHMKIDNFIMDMTERFDEHSRTLATFEGRLSQLESENEELRATMSLGSQNESQFTQLKERIQALEEATAFQELAEKLENIEINQVKITKTLDSLEPMVADAAAKVIREEITALMSEE